MSYKVNTSTCVHFGIYETTELTGRKRHISSPAMDIRKHSILNFYLIMTPMSQIMGCH